MAAGPKVTSSVKHRALWLSNTPAVWKHVRPPEPTAFHREENDKTDTRDYLIKSEEKEKAGAVEKRLKVSDIAFIACDQAAVESEPREGALDLPAPFVTAQCTSIQVQKPGVQSFHYPVPGSHVMTSPCYPQPSGKLERFHKTRPPTHHSRPEPNPTTNHSGCSLTLLGLWNIHAEPRQNEEWRNGLLEKTRAATQHPGSGGGFAAEPRPMQHGRHQGHKRP